MSEDRINALRVELASMQETGNPRAEQVRAALQAAGALPADEPETAQEAPKRGRGRPPTRKETAPDKTPKETA